MKRNHIYNIHISLSNKQQLILLENLLNNRLFKGKSLHSKRKKKSKIIVNKSPHVNSKAKKKYEDFKYSFVNKNQNKFFLIMLKKLFSSNIIYQNYKKLV